MAKGRHTKKRATARVVIRYMGSIETPSFHLVDGYSVVVDGRETQPWFQLREAKRVARDVATGLGVPRNVRISVERGGRR